MKGVQCYELFFGIERENHAFFIIFEYLVKWIGNKTLKTKIWSTFPVWSLLRVLEQDAI